MDTERIQELVEDLGSDIDKLEEALMPLISEAFAASTSKLPLLEKGKLYVLAVYAIESILFSYLRLNGVDAKQHPVFQELTRVKEYFAKIKAAETKAAEPAGPNARINRAATDRVIKHGLSGNDRYDRERAERESRRKSAKPRGKHTRFEEERVTVVKAADVNSSGDED